MTMPPKKDTAPLPEDLRVFLTVVRKGGFAAAAEELGLSPAYVSKRIQILETTLGSRLLHRTSRRVALTDDGERVQRWAVRILDDVQQLQDELSEAHTEPRGRLHLCSSFGFGRNHVAPAISLLAEQYPELEIRLDVFDRVVDIVHEGFDLEIHVGDDIAGQHIGRRLVTNNRVLCASPDYLRRRGRPRTPGELADHDCLLLFGSGGRQDVWRLGTPTGGEVAVRVQGRLESNFGEVLRDASLAGEGIVIHSLWHVADDLRAGRLEVVLPDYPLATTAISAVMPQRRLVPPRVRAFTEFLIEEFGDAPPWERGLPC